MSFRLYRFIPLLCPVLGVWAGLCCSVSAGAALLTGRLVDAASGELLAGRVMVETADGQFHQAKSMAADGTAVPYTSKRGGLSQEIHTTVSAHAWSVDVPPGDVTVWAFRGLEWRAEPQKLSVGADGADVVVKLSRWADWRARGYFSGDVFSHRPLSQSAHLVEAEDLNVLFPIHHWVTQSGLSPINGNQNKPGVVLAEAISVGPQRVVWPLNTEVELFTVGKAAHMQGAVWIFGQKAPLVTTVPPLAALAQEARSVGAVIDTEKPNWPWTFMATVVGKLSHYRVLNNHHWRVPFASGSWLVMAPPASWGVEKDAKGQWTEAGWTTFGLQSWYALLNCGLPLLPTAGTGSGVHPVPVGFSRTYVQVVGDFSYEKWMQGLKAGSLFVTNGPLLDVTFDAQRPGTQLIRRKLADGQLTVKGQAVSADGPVSVELIINGRVVATAGGVSGEFKLDAPISRSGWAAVRSWGPVAGAPERHRLAHSAPVWFEVEDFPLRPRRDDLEWFIQLMDAEIARHQSVLPADAVAEYESAKAFYVSLLPLAEESTK